MLGKIVGKLHILIILYSAFQMFTYWDENQQRVESFEMQIPGLQGRITQSGRELQQLKTYNNDLEEARKRIELVAEEVERTQRQLPAQISDLENLNILRKTAEGLNIREVNVVPLEEELRSFYYVKKYQLKAHGTFLQFMIFFEKVAENERLLNINQLKLTRRDGGERGRFQVIDAEVTIEAYRYNPDYREDRGIN